MVATKLSAPEIAALAVLAAPTNTARVLTAQSNRTIMADVTLVVTNSAINSDSPAQTITFSLLTSPAGANRNPSNRILTWRPTVAQPTLSNGTFGLSIAGDLGPDYSIYASTNLLNWNLLLTTNPFALPVNFTDPGATNFNLRFYRVLLGP